MNMVSIIHFSVVATTFTLGALVFRTNPKRSTNKIYLLLSLASGLWIAFIGFAFFCHDIPFAAAWIRSSHSVGATIPLLCDWLRLSIIHPDLKFRRIISLNPILIFLSLLLVVLSQTKWLIASARIPAPGSHPSSIPDAVLGPYYFVFAILFTLILCALAFRFWQSRRAVTGMQRLELNFICLGVLTSIAMGIAVSILVPMLTGNSQSTQFSSLSVMLLNFVIAYGIATRRIMDMAYLFRLLTSYVLISVYLAAIYLVVWWPVRQIGIYFDITLGTFAHILASIAVAFSMAPAHGRMQKVATLLFVHSAPMNMLTVSHLTDQLLRSLNTVDTLVGEFASAMAKAVGTDKVCVLLAGTETFVQKFPPADPSHLLNLEKAGSLPKVLAKNGAMVVPAVLRRLNPLPVPDPALRVIEENNFSAAIGLLSKEGLEGILLLGPKLNGSIYGAPEQYPLQLLCNQMAVALNNARLYTQLQDSKIYNEILVDNLSNGIIAVRHDGTISVFNREAQRITRLSANQTLNHSLSILPPLLNELLNETFTKGDEITNQEMTLPVTDSDPTPVRISSAVIHGHTGKRLGAFLVISDMTALKQLEHQVRRTDRLASLGTLSAGMAHEIKNPLVSIKTFTQLLPERFEDPDFRETFTSLVGGEVKRIDSIVNQLLRFSRPAKPVLAPTPLHELLNSTLKLLHQQMRAKNIRMSSSFTAARDLINADGDQLSQAFVNFILNAIESMQEHGTLTVTTTISPRSLLFNGRTEGKLDQADIRVTIQDTGEGIPADALPHIFDPFFTTKGQGTGLGLSVAHGIIQEHGGTINVTSEPGRGSSFAITFPLLDKEPAV